MPERQIIVFETRPRWAPVLQREPTLSDCRIRTCLSVSDLLLAAAACHQHAAAFVAILDFSFGPAICLPLPQRLNRFHPLGVIALGTPETDVLEPSLRELGVTSYHPVWVECRRLARECRRLLTPRDDGS